RWRMRNEVLVEPVLETPLDVPGIGAFNSRLYRAHDGGLHLAVWKGSISGDPPVLARIQAAIPVIDVFGSGGVSDSNLQLELALRQIESAGRGVLLYLHVSGSYTVDETLAQIREHLGLADQDGSSAGSGPGALRELGVGAQILVNMGARRLKLMTNNPRKLMGLEGFGLEVVERVPLQVPVSEKNAAFLQNRRLQLGHLIPDPNVKAGT
ncbi:MAG: bifunctional 3,4-dihydroxy-2-butanone-4-phosphate synthase/GTP cyclohydrolase II, partial [Myxococcota bacterium]